MDANAIIKKMKEARDSWVDLAGGKRVCVRRPVRADMHRVCKLMSVDLARDVLVGWEGFTEADLLGASIGSAEPVAFDLDLAVLWVSDNPSELSKVVQNVNESILKAFETTQADTKN